MAMKRLGLAKSGVAGVGRLLCAAGAVRGRLAAWILAVVVAGGVAVTAAPAPVDALATTTISSQAGPSTSITLGTGENDLATVQGNATSGSPTGTVSFYACQTGTSQTLTTGTCGNSPGNLLGIVSAATNGANDTASWQFSSFVARSAGSWCFSAVYSGDGNYSGSQDNTPTSGLDADECFLVTTIAPTIQTTTTPGTMVLGSGTVTDQVKVMGTTTGGKPTGTVAFYVCLVSPSPSLTTGPCAPGGTPEDPGEALVTGADDVSNASAAPFTPTGSGTWCFSVTYGGNADYSASNDNTDNSNLDAGECVLVTPAPSSSASTVSPSTVTVGPSGALTDAVTVNGITAGGAPTGTVVFYACLVSSSLSLTPGPCTPSGTPVDAGETLTAGAGTSSTTASQPFTPTSAGTWCFSAVYEGSGTYQPSSDNATSQNADARECALVDPVPYTIYTPDHGVATAGQVLSPAISVMAFPSSPKPRFRKVGRLPPQVRFRVTGPGSATISGKPGKKLAGTYTVTIEAIWGTGKHRTIALQTFTLTVG